MAGSKEREPGSISCWIVFFSGTRHPRIHKSPMFIMMRFGSDCLNVGCISDLGEKHVHISCGIKNLNCSCESG